jgi:putative inorganic carbon (hco3(-)) transporter
MHGIPAYLWPSLAFLLFAWNAPELGGLEPFDQQRLFQIFCFASTSACLLLIPSAREPAKRMLSHVSVSHGGLLATALALGFCSAVTSSLPIWSMIEWMLAVQLLVVAAAVATARLTAQETTDLALLGAISFSALAYTAVLVLEYLSVVLTSDVVDLAAIHPRFSNPRFAGQMFTLVLPLLIAASCLPGKLQYAGTVSAVILVGFTLSQGTRGTWLSLLCGAAALIAVRPPDFQRYLRRFTAVATFGVLAYVVQVQAPQMLGKEVITGLSRATSVYTFTHDSGRLLIWQSAVHEAMDRPVLGIGPMNFAAVQDGIVSHPHNIALQLASEWGLPAALALVVLYSSLLLQFGRISRAGLGSTQQVIFCGLLASLVGAAVQSLLDGVFVVPTSQMTIFVLAGWAAGILASSRPATVAPLAQATIPLRRLAGSCVIVTAVGLSAVALHPSHQITALKSHYCNGMNPRFWMNGAIGPIDFPERRNTCSSDRV